MSHLVALLSLLLLFHQHQPPVGVRARPIHRDQTKTTSNAMQNEIKSKNSNKLTSSHWWLVRPSRASRVVDSFVVWRLLNEQNKKKKKQNTDWKFQHLFLSRARIGGWVLRLSSYAKWCARFRALQSDREHETWTFLFVFREFVWVYYSWYSYVYLYLLHTRQMIQRWGGAHLIVVRLRLCVDTMTHIMLLRVFTH